MDIKYRQSESTVKPEAVEIGKTTVFLRSDINKEIRADELGNDITVWTYQEAKMTPDEFTAYADLLNSKNIVDNVNTNNQMIIMEAIADLYDKISDIQGGSKDD